MAGMISECKCGSRRISVQYHELSHAYFNEDGNGREDGHDVEESYLDTDTVFCRDCYEPRTLTQEDLKLIGEGE